MKIGFFDSGLGGLLIARSVQQHMADMDTLYLGDTLHVPYGARSSDAVYNFTRRAVTHLFEEGCALVIVACNTASAIALRKLQQSWLMDHYPDRRVLGVVVPTLEEAVSKKYKKIGLLATNGTIQSNVYKQELQKIDRKIELVQQACPLLVPLIENNGRKWVRPILEEYLTPLLEAQIETLILGCTHYPYLKDEIKSALGDTDIPLISQDEIIPHKLKDYLTRHPEIEEKISKNGQHKFHLTDITETYRQTAKDIYGQDVDFKKVRLPA